LGTRRCLIGPRRRQFCTSRHCPADCVERRARRVEREIQIGDRALEFLRSTVSARCAQRHIVLDFTIFSCILNVLFIGIVCRQAGNREMYQATKTMVVGNLGLLVGAAAAYAVLCGVLVGSHPLASMSSGVVAWWAGLCAVSIINLCGWRLAATALARRKATVDPAVYRFQRQQLLLSAVYVLGCGFRSILPRADVQRIGLYDSWMSSVLVGRSVATVAELCFVIQWALLLRMLARDSSASFAGVVSWLLVPLIVVAEVCSWYSVLTTSYLGNAVEESLWALSASLMLVSGLSLWSRCATACRPYLVAGLALASGYVAFMCAVDIPMYVSRWLADEANGREYLSFSQGLEDVWCRWSVTFEWDQWQTEIPWMSLYFTVAVWCSIALVHVPWYERQPKCGEECSPRVQGEMVGGGLVSSALA
jgi:hypothetical protein